MARALKGRSGRGGGRQSGFLLMERSLIILMSLALGLGLSFVPLSLPAPADPPVPAKPAGAASGSALPSELALADPLAQLARAPEWRHAEPEYYYQKDSRWAGALYGSATFADTGCVPASLAMAFSGILRHEVLPTETADYLYVSTNEFNRRAPGTTGTGIELAARHYEVGYLGIATLARLKEALAAGCLIIAVVGPGSFTNPGYTHAVVAYGLDRGLTYVEDPAHPERNGWYRAAELWAQRSGDPLDLDNGFCFHALY